ncbi:MAG: trypsin-like peptidase domain-containing protein [Dorea sp.]|nr:trypsin-like peptidase domain-containing protein [Dorea sp.]
MEDKYTSYPSGNQNDSPEGQQHISGNTEKIVIPESALNEEQSAYTAPETDASAYSYNRIPEERRTYGYGPRYGSSPNAEDQRGQSYTYQSSHTVPPTNPPKKRKKSGFGKAIALGLVFGLVAGSVFTGVSVVGNRVFNKPSTSIGKEVGKTELAISESGAISAKSDVAKIAANVMPSVVSITNMSVQQVRSFFGGVQEYESESAGSGIIIGQNDAELLVLTNNHVVADAKTLTVSFVDKESVSASVKGTDASLDVAVVSVPLSEIQSSTMDAIKIATLGDSNSLQVGETAIAIGNALGYGQSVTCGIISALERTLEDYEGGTLIQTDAAINPGNSGGALLNANGEVIGINVAKVAQSAVEGMGYAIPISNASEVITNLMNKQTRVKVDEAKRGYIGIQGVDVSQETSQYYNIPVGVYISEVIKGGGAEKAGLTKGTVITALDGTKIDSMNTLVNELSYYAIGDEVTLTLMVPSSNGEYTENTVVVTLGKAS